MATKLSFRDALYLRWQWFLICRKLGVSYDRAELNNLLAMYAEDQRFYHTIQHILECLRFVDFHFKFVPDVWLVKLALVYHDCRYDIGSKTNEADSADRFQAWAKSRGVSMMFIPRVTDLILLTASHKVPGDASVLAKVMSDADMHIFLCPDAHYLEYARNIWREYGPAFGEQAYRAGRLDFLSKLDPATIFNMHQLRGLLKHARANIELEIDLLTNHPDQILVPLS